MLTQHDCIGMTSARPSRRGRPASLLKLGKDWQVIDTITTKVVLIVGRFTPERKAVLDALRKTLRLHPYSPIVFDLERLASRDSTEMVSILSHPARFMLVDLTDASRASDAVATIIPQTFVPVQPLIKSQPLMIDGKAAATHDTTYCAFITTSSPNCEF